MSDKYIIKNCPAFVLMRTATSGTYFNMCGNAKGHIKCADCTDCVMKQIVELCKEVNTKFYDSVHQRYLSPSKAKFARQILELLEIQEIE